MKKIIFYPFIGLATLALGVAVTFLGINTMHLPIQEAEELSIPVEQKDITGEIPILAFYELANNPEKYDGKIVRVSAKLLGFEDGLRFRDLNCNGEKNAAVLEDGRFYSQTVFQITDGLGKGGYDFLKEIEIIAVVKLSRIKPTGKTYRFIDNSHLLVEIMRVEKARELN